MNNSTVVTNPTYSLIDMCFGFCFIFLSFFLFLSTLYYIILKLIGET
jgi:hypothetical protein